MVFLLELVTFVERLYHRVWFTVGLFVITSLMLPLSLSSENGTVLRGYLPISRKQHWRSDVLKHEG